MSSALWRAYVAWRAAAGPLQDFVFPTAFLAEQPARPAQPVHPSAAGLASAAQHVAGVGTAFFLEAPPRLALATGRALASRGWLVAPLFGRWPVPRAVLPVTDLTRWLAAPPPPARDSIEGITLLLDAERRRRVSRATLRRRFDNRYDYGAQQLPPLSVWRDLGVTRLLWAGSAAGISPDLAVYAEEMGRGGLAIETLSFAHLTARAGSGPGAGR